MTGAGEREARQFLIALQAAREFWAANPEAGEEAFCAERRKLAAAGLARGEEGWYAAHTGGGVMVALRLLGPRLALGVTDESVVLYEAPEEAEDEGLTAEEILYACDPERALLAEQLQ